MLSYENVDPKERKRTPADEENSILSPATGAPMVPFLYRGVEVDYCEKSNAVWFDPGEIERANLKPEPRRRAARLSHRIERDPFDGFRDKANIAYYFDVGILGDFIQGIFDAF